MKLFTAVQAPISGTVLAVHAADGDLVEFGQPLLSLDPDG
jgi:biotin carboxyl carrier protein